MEKMKTTNVRFHDAGAPRNPLPGSIHKDFRVDSSRNFKNLEPEPGQVLLFFHRTDTHSYVFSSALAFLIHNKQPFFLAF